MSCSSLHSLFFFFFFRFLLFQHFRQGTRPLTKILDSISSWSSMTRARTRVCACVIYVFSRLSSVRAGSTLPPSPTHQHHLHSPSSNCPTKLFKNVCQRFGGRFPWEANRIRELKLCYSSSADSRSTRPGWTAFPLPVSISFSYLHTFLFYITAIRICGERNCAQLLARMVHWIPLKYDTLAKYYPCTLTCWHKQRKRQTHTHSHAQQPHQCFLWH